MTVLRKRRKEIDAAWRSFVVDGQLPESIRAEIRRSWQRARADWHVDPALHACPRALRAGNALQRAGAEEALRVASPLITDFARRLASDGHVVAYFDGDGVMLTMEGNHSTRSRLADINFAPGACWAEDTAGTNGVGTALMEGRPVEVFASEHFVEAWQPWTCASVPVRLDGHVIGVVDITSPWTAHSPGLLLTAEALARAMEAGLEAAAVRRQNATLLHVAQGALRARDEFLAVASHELKTPLTPLQLKLQLVQRLVTRSAAPLDAAELADALRGAEQHVGRLVERIDDLLEASRWMHHPLRLAVEPMDLGATVRSVVEQQRSELDRQGCDVTLTAPRQVLGRWDTVRIAQAFKHLLVNAMKYAPGRIEVAVETDAASARVVVRDRGPGIAPEDQARIFLPFERAVSYRNAAGLGLGLYAVREIIEAHGGAVRVESTPGKGSAFVIELPLDSATAGTRLATSDAPPAHLAASVASLSTCVRQRSGRGDELTARPA